MSDRDFETGERMKDETQPHDLQQASPLYVASLARGMVLLESFRDGAPLLGITDLVRITGFEKNLVQRLTNTLYQMGYLGKDQARRKYYLAHPDPQLQLPALAQAVRPRHARAHLPARGSA